MASEQITQYAKELYLTPHKDDTAKHQYSYQQIASAILREYDEKLTKQTISEWSKTPDGNGLTWMMLWEQGQRVGMEKIIEQKKADETYDESYFNAITEEKSKRQKVIESHFDGSAQIVSVILQNEAVRIKQHIKDGTLTEYEPARPAMQFIQTNYIRLNQQIMESEREMKEGRNQIVDLIKSIFANPELLRDPEVLEAYAVEKKRLEAKKNG
jgi:hypothetical protein